MAHQGVRLAIKRGPWWRFGEPRPLRGIHRICSNHCMSTRVSVCVAAPLRTLHDEGIGGPETEVPPRQTVSTWLTPVRRNDPGTCAVRESPAPMYASAPWLCAIVPTSLLPAVLLPGSLASNEYRWVFESMFSVGDISIGLPGLVSLGIFLSPLFEIAPRIRRERDVGQLPLLPYTAMAGQGFVWSAYGLMMGNPAIYTPNMCAVLLGLYYTGIYVQNCPKGADWLPFTRWHHAAGIISLAGFCTGVYFCLPTDTAITTLGITGNIMTIIMFGGPLSAMRTVIKERSTRSMGFAFTCIVNLNCNLWAFYAYFFISDPYIFFQDGIGLLLSTVQLALFARYGIHR